MPSITSLTINDGLATPVGRVFVPNAKYPVVVWEYNNGGFPSSFPRITVQGTKNPKTGLFRGRQTIAVPKVDASGLILSVSRINIEVIHAANSDAAQRADTRAYAFNSQAMPSFAQAFYRDMEGWF